MRPDNCASTIPTVDEDDDNNDDADANDGNADGNGDVFYVCCQVKSSQVL